MCDEDFRVYVIPHKRSEEDDRCAEALEKFLNWFFEQDKNV